MQAALKRAAPPRSPAWTCCRSTRIPPAHLIQADFTDPGVGEQPDRGARRPASTWCSRTWPTTPSAAKRTDHLKIIALIEAAADFAIENSGNLAAPSVSKNFQGGSAGEVLAHLKAAFAEVKFVKPKSSRTGSSEVYLVATGFKGR